MLNELIIVERGARLAGLEISERHQDIKDAGKKPTLRVRLGSDGDVRGIDPIPREVPLWTLGKGNKKRFPFLQPNAPFLRLPPDLESGIELTRLSKFKGHERRRRLLELCEASKFDGANLSDWPGSRDKNGGWSQEPTDYLDGLRGRIVQLSVLRGTDAECVLAVLERFVLACEVPGSGAALLHNVAEELRERLEESPSEDWVRVAEALLLLGGGALYFDVPSTEFGRLVSAASNVPVVTAALRGAKLGWNAGVAGINSDDVGDAAPTGGETVGDGGTRCSLTGTAGPLVKDTFPEVIAPAIDKTIIFSRFDAIPANGRYGRFGADSFPVSQGVADRLAAALLTLTAPQYNGKTWRKIPGEAPKRYDLLLAFVYVVPDAPMADSLLDDDECADWSGEKPGTMSIPNSVAAFEKRTERVIEAVRAVVTADFTQTPVRLAVLRKVDPANRKVIYAGEVSVKDYYHAASVWALGERNVPPWLELPIVHQGETKLRLTPPLHIAPLGVIAFSRQLFVRGGIERQEIVGLPASEAMGLYLEDNPARVKRILKLVLVRRTLLVAGAAHALRRSLNTSRGFDWRETLRTATMLGVLLHKLGRHAGSTRGDYMRDIAFKLGQLLAASDIVHAGYCADVRGGAVPPSLLGNQVFTMAQTAPSRALATLCRRWRPYEGWVQKAVREQSGYESLRKKHEQRYWDIRKALRYAREMRTLASEIAPSLAKARVDDVFRAELLLGYLAGLPKAQKDGEPEAVDASSDHS